MVEQPQLQAKLQAALARHLGAPVEIHDLARLTGGATKTTWAFDAQLREERLPLILQLSVRPAMAPDDPARRQPRLFGGEDAGIAMAAGQAGVPVPAVRAVLDESDGLGLGFVAERVPGEVLGRKIAGDPAFAAARRRLTTQVGQVAARIHSIDPAGLPFLTRHTPEQHVAAWRDTVDYYGLVNPTVELCLRWCAEHLPRAHRMAVVHGDFRNGNLIVDERGLRAVLDWEVGHVSDPMSDLGWVCSHTWRFGGPLPVGGFGTREELFSAYEAAGGGPVDPALVAVWEVFGCLRWALVCLRKGQAYRHGEPMEVEGLAIGRRLEEPLLDFLDLLHSGA